MDNPTTPTTDDAELAKVLENMNQQAAGGMPVTDQPAEDSQQTATEDVPAPEIAMPSEPAFTPPMPTTETPTQPEVPPVDNYAAPSSDLEGIKKDALEELRPLVGKLDLPADEKFDTLLLIIRSTDDKSLLSPAYEAAKSIPDETRRAQALLDVIKEIDYFSQPQQ